MKGVQVVLDILAVLGERGSVFDHEEEGEDEKEKEESR